LIENVAEESDVHFRSVSFKCLAAVGLINVVVVVNYVRKRQPSLAFRGYPFYEVDVTYDQETELDMLMKQLACLAPFFVI